MIQDLDLSENTDTCFIHEPLELPALPDAVRSDLEQRLGVKIEPDHKVDMELRLIAWSYRDEQRDVPGTERAIRRKRMRAMAKALTSALAAHEPMDATDLHRIVSASPEADLQDFFQFVDQLRKWTPVFQELAQEKLSQGQEEDARLDSCCRRLVRLYEAVTGTPATHTSRDSGGDEIGEPQSKAGRFVWTFFVWLDPQALVHVNEVLRKIIWPSRQSKRARLITFKRRH